MARLAAKRILGSKKRKRLVHKVNAKRAKTKIKLKIKAASPEGLASAVGKLAEGISKK